MTLFGTPPLESGPTKLLRGRTLQVVKTLGEHGLYWLALVTSRAAGLLTVPVYARLLGPEDFGRYELLISLMALLYSVLFVGMDFAMAVRYYAASPAERRRDLASALTVTIGLTGLAAALITGFSPVLASWLLRDGGYALAVAVVGLAMPFNVLSGVWGMRFRLDFRPQAFFLATIIGTLTGSFMGVVLVVVGRMGVTGAVGGVGASYVLSAAIGTWLNRGSAGLRDLSIGNTISLLRLGLPLVPAGAAMWVFALSDRLFVSAFAGLQQLGLYAAAARVTTVLALAQGGFQLAWMPIALKWGARSDREVLYRDSLRRVAAIGGAGVIVMSVLAAPSLELLAGADYVSASGVVWLLAGSVLLNAMFYVATIGLNLMQRSGLLGWATVAAATANTALNIALVPGLGYHGAAAATLGAYLIACVAGYVLAQRALPMRLAFVQSLGIATLSIAVSALFALQPDGLTLLVALATAVGLVVYCSLGIRNARIEAGVR
jgi:O-antigen/teichoic acid export membrane protein